MAKEKIYSVEYMVVGKNLQSYSATEESEGTNPIDAAWNLQQKIKNDVDPNGKGVNVFVNLNTVSQVIEENMPESYDYPQQ